MKTLVLFVLFSLYIQADSIKSELDIAKILQQIDTISENIKQKQMMQNNQPEQIQTPQIDDTTSKQMELESSILKQEQELELKEKKLEILRKKQEYEKKYEDITNSTLKKRSAYIESQLLAKLKELKLKQRYSLPINQYMKIGKHSYAYIPQNKLEQVKSYINDIGKKIENIKKSLATLRVAKATDRDRWIQIVTNLENRIEETPSGIKFAVSSQSQPNSKKEYVRVKEGDDFENIKILKVTENKVIIVPITGI